MDKLILHIESATKACSVAISRGEECIAFKEEVDINYSHAEKLNLFVEEVLAEAGLELKDLDAVAVSKGPGSFTGLRIGVAVAKGYAYALSIPMIATSTLKGLYYQLAANNELDAQELVIPMIDARRREVYTQTFSNSGEATNEIHAEVIEKNSFDSLEAKTIHLIGDGAAKFESDFEADARIRIHANTYPSARYMIPEAVEAFNSNRFEDIAYFEPFYLKDFN